MYINWSNRASKNLEDFLAYCYQENPSAADAIYQEVQHQLKLLLEFPEMGSLDVFSPRKNVRRIFVKPIFILYEVIDDEIFIAACRHSSQSVKW